MPTMTPEQYLQDRIEDQIRWSGDRSRSNQTTHRRLRTIEIVLAASIPLLAGYVGEVPSLRVAVGAAGVLLAVIAGVFSLYRFHENWVSYRNTGEALKRETFLYLTGAPPYTEPNAFYRGCGRHRSFGIFAGSGEPRSRGSEHIDQPRATL